MQLLCQFGKYIIKNSNKKEILIFTLDKICVKLCHINNPIYELLNILPLWTKDKGLAKSLELMRLQI